MPAVPVRALVVEPGTPFDQLAPLLQVLPGVVPDCQYESAAGAAVPADAAGRPAET
jgi:hypothetical protein